MVDLLYVLKRKKDGTFSSGDVSYYKKEEFYEFCKCKHWNEYPGFKAFDNLDEMQNCLDKCTERTRSKTIYIGMPTFSFECIEITKLPFKEIVKIANSEPGRKFMGFYLANSKIYAFSYFSE